MSRATCFWGLNGSYQKAVLPPSKALGWKSPRGEKNWHILEARPSRQSCAFHRYIDSRGIRERTPLEPNTPRPYFDYAQQQLKTKRHRLYGVHSEPRKTPQNRCRCSSLVLTMSAEKKDIVWI